MALPPTPPPAGPPEAKPQLGITVDPAAVVVEVLPATPAARAGLQPGDVVIGVDNHTVSSSKTLRDALERTEKSDEILLTVAHGGETEKVRATMAEHPQHHEEPAAVGHEAHP
jgi:S1-C subfamily serine protease